MTTGIRRFATFLLSCFSLLVGLTGATTPRQLEGCFDVLPKVELRSFERLYLMRCFQGVYNNVFRPSYWVSDVSLLENAEAVATRLDEEGVAKPNFVVEGLDPEDVIVGEGLFASGGCLDCDDSALPQQDNSRRRLFRGSADFSLSLTQCLNYFGLGDLYKDLGPIQVIEKHPMACKRVAMGAAPPRVVVVEQGDQIDTAPSTLLATKTAQGEKLRQSTSQPTSSPSVSLVASPTTSPFASPTTSPVASPTTAPPISVRDSTTASPTDSPTISPSASLTGSPSGSPTGSPSTSRTGSPSTSPTGSRSESPTTSPSRTPTKVSPP